MLSGNHKPGKMGAVLKYILVIAIVARTASGDETTTEIVDTTTVTTEEVPTTTEELPATTEVTELEAADNETDTRQAKDYYIYRRYPVRNRGSMKYKHQSPPRNKVHPGWQRPRPVPWIKPQMVKTQMPGLKTDFSDYHIIDIQKTPVYDTKAANQVYKVEEGPDGDLEAAGSEPLPSLSSIVAPVMGVSQHVNDTVLQVEKILSAHPELPRLNRTEILDFLHNITEADKKEELQLRGSVLESENTGGEVDVEGGKEEKGEGSRSREDDNRSLLVVLPFKASDETDMEELFTRRPVVQVVEDDVHKVTTYAPKFNMDEFKKNQNQNQNEPAYIPMHKEDPKYSPPLRVIGYRRNTPTTTPTPVTTKSYTNYHDIELVTQKFSWNMENETGSVSNHKPHEFHVPEEVNNFGVEDAVVNEVSGAAPTESAIFLTNPLPDITESPKYSSKYSRPTTAGPKGGRTTTTTTEGPPDIEPVMELLPDHMKDVLKHIGLGQQSGEDLWGEAEPPRPEPAKPTIDPLSFLVFKPLPTHKQKTVADDMRDFLATFGLMQHDRVAKTMKFEPPKPRKYLEAVPQINADILPDDLKGVLQDLGLYRSHRESRIHIFSPNNHTLNHTEEEVKKLNSLLSTIKKLTSLNETDPVSEDLQAEVLDQVRELENLTISTESNSTVTEIKQLMTDNKTKFNFTIPFEEPQRLKAGPDPMDFDGEDFLKNEVKRQENGTAADDAKSGEAEAPSEEATTEPANAAGLEDSFGGGDTAPADADVESSLPPKRPNGLYLLLDWNSFLEVGTEDDARRVNIRFQPKIGDGRNFLPITVP